MASRRDVLRASSVVALGGLAGSLLAACGGGDSKSGPAAGGSAAPSGKARFTWWGGDERAKQTQAVIKSFESSHEGASITAQFSDWGSYWQKLTTTAAGGNLPDVLQMDVSYVQQFAKNNQLLVLDDYSSKQLALTGTDKALLVSGTVGGKLYAVGTGGNMSTLMYNETALTTAGMPVPDDGFTWDTLASFAVSLQKKMPADRWAIDAGYASIWFDVFMRQRHTEAWTPDGKIAYSKDDVQDWFNYWYGLQQAGVVATRGKAPNSASGSDADSAFGLGFTVLAAEWTNLFPTAAALTKDKVALTRTPTGGSMIGDSVNATMMWSIAAGSKNVDLAVSLVAYLLHDPTAVKTIGLDRGVPGTAAARKLLDPSLDALDKAQVAFLEKYGDKGRPVTVFGPAYAGEITDALTQAGDSISLGKASPEQATTLFWDSAQKISGA